MLTTPDMRQHLKNEILKFSGDDEKLDVARFAELAELVLKDLEEMIAAVGEIRSDIKDIQQELK